MRGLCTFTETNYPQYINALCYLYSHYGLKNIKKYNKNTTTVYNQHFLKSLAFIFGVYYLPICWIRGQQNNGPKKPSREKFHHFNFFIYFFILLFGIYRRCPFSLELVTSSVLINSFVALILFFMLQDFWLLLWSFSSMIFFQKTKKSLQYDCG